MAYAPSEQPGISK